MSKNQKQSFPIKYNGMNNIKTLGINSKIINDRNLLYFIQQFIDSLPQLIIVIDATKNYSVVLVNKHMATSLGVSVEKLIGKNLLDFFPPGELQKRRKAYADMTIHNKKITKSIDKRGDRYFYNCTFPVFDSSGEVIYVIAMVDEITEKKELEKSLADKEQFFSSMIQNSEDMIYILTNEGNIIYRSPSVRKLLGYQNEPIGTSGFNNIHPKEREYVKEQFNLLVSKSNNVMRITFRVRDAKGTYHFLEGIGSNQLKNPIINGVIFNCRDVTEKVRTDNKLKQSKIELMEQKEYLKNVIDSASEIIISFDKNNVVTTWNRTAELITKYRSREVLGRNINRLGIFLNQDDLNNYFHSVLNGHAKPFEDITLQPKTGARKLVRVSGSIINGDTAGNDGILLVGRDITRDSELHGKLIPGNSYLIINEKSKFSLILFKDLTVSGFDGLYITRVNPNEIQVMFSSLDVKVVLLSEDKTNGFEYVRDINGLITKIKKFAEEKSRPLILLDRIDFLLSIFSFEEFIRALYRINNILAINNAIFLVRINPNSVDKRQMEIIKEELLPLPSQKIENIAIEDKLYEILNFIQRQNQDNMLVTYSKIGYEFSISKATTSKYLNLLSEKDLVFIERDGKSKTLLITEKGKTLLHKRMSI